MSDNFYKAFLGLFYVSTFGAMLYLCGNFLDAVRAHSESQKKAAWTQVYWARRGQLMAEKDWQQKWEASHAADYCNHLLQEAAAGKASKRQRP